MASGLYGNFNETRKPKTTAAVKVGHVEVKGTISDDGKKSLVVKIDNEELSVETCLLYTSPSPRDRG